MINYIAQQFEKKNMNTIVLENRYYFCYQCQKNTCYACSTFLHRNHDKIYLAKTGLC
jgi:hypothetical protein